MSKQSVKKRFDLVGKKFENKLFKTNPLSTSGSFNHVRCLRSSLSSSPQQYSSCLYKSFRRGGTRSLELNSIAVKMWAWCPERNMILSAPCVPGIMNKAAYLLSHLKLESTEWVSSPKIFKQIVYVYRMPVLDMFSSTLSHQVPKYFSWILHPEAVGMDTFSVN